MKKQAPTAGIGAKMPMIFTHLPRNSLRRKTGGFSSRNGEISTPNRPLPWYRENSLPHPDEYFVVIRDPIAADRMARGHPPWRSMDLWILGKHRLWCSDARKTADDARLMKGELAAIVFTQPLPTH